MGKLAATLEHGLSRREIMLGAGATLLSPHAVSVADARISATGVVFDDRNGDGIRRNGGGIPNILVSNGRDVVATDDEGRWNLPVADGDHLFVVKPSHWTTPHGPRRRSPILPSTSTLGQS